MPGGPAPLHQRAGRGDAEARGLRLTPWFIPIHLTTHANLSPASSKHFQYLIVKRTQPPQIPELHIGFQGLPFLLCI